MDDPAKFEAELRTAIVKLWRREAELSGLERLKLYSLMLNLKALWLAAKAPAP